MTPEFFSACTPPLSGPAALEACLAPARRRGYVLDQTGENTRFASVVAAPVLSLGGELAAAISIVIMREPENEERSRALGARVHAAAMEISRALGFLGDDLFFRAR